MRLLFCRDPSSARQPEEPYLAEGTAAGQLGIPFDLIDHDALVHDHEPARATLGVRSQSNPELAMYRGWMMTPGQYRLLFEALEAKGVRLINDPDAYRHCHFLPESYAVIERYTPRSVWIRTAGPVDFEEIMALLQPFGGRPVVVKDFVKSRKHEWAEACFIPSASDREAVKRVVRRFLELQGDDLAEGLVFREYEEFEPLGRHPRSGMPLAREYRLFCLDGQVVFGAPYWEEAEYRAVEPPPELFAGVAAQVRSRFFTMDIARKKDGDWRIVELGDGQVAGLPGHADVTQFYRALRDHWPCGSHEGPVPQT